jgi:UDP-glucuronate 4-epimerase
MRVLVTGGAGFIGSHLVESLLADGHAVTLLDNFDPFYPPSLKRQTVAMLAARAPAGALTVIEGDIRSAMDVRRAFEVERPAVVAHLAALAGVRPSRQRPEAYTDVNVTGTTVLLEAARAAGVRRFLFASSSSVYGESAAMPFREEDGCGRPISVYAATKRAGELLCHTYAHLYSMKVICPRFFTVYGPRQRPDLAIHKFCRAIVDGVAIPLYGDGHTRRDYTYVSEIIDGVRRALDWTAGEGPEHHEPSPRPRSEERAGPAFEIVNLGGARTTPLIDLVRHLERLLGRTARIEWLPEQPGDVPLTCADTAHARRLLGYEPRVPIEEGLARFVDWFRSGEWRVPTQWAEAAAPATVHRSPFTTAHDVGTRHSPLETRS